MASDPEWVAFMSNPESPTTDYQAGFDAGAGSARILGGESEEWLRGFRDGAGYRAERERMDYDQYMSTVSA